MASVVSAGVLSGVRVVSMAVNVPGPATVARLVGAGAAAVKIEPPWGDPLATLCPSFYQELHRGVECVTLDLKSPPGLDALVTRLTSADLFIASHRPSALARLGLDAAALTARLPRLRSLNIVGDSAHPEEAGHDLTYQATEGLVGRDLPPTLLADMAGAERAFATSLLLLQAPAGTHAEMALVDALRALLAPRRHGLTAAGGILGGANPAYQIYGTRDGFIAVAALEPHFRARLYEALSLPDGTLLTDAFLARTAAEWETWARDRDIPLAMVVR